MSALVIGRRGFIGGFAAILAAPAIVRVESLMSVRGVPLYSARSLLTVNMITREAVRMFVNSNVFLQNINRQYDEEFGVEGAKIGSTLRIRLPNDFKIEDRNRLHLNPITEAQRCVTLLPRDMNLNVPASLVVAAGAAAVVSNNPVVSRRFWDRE